MDANPVVWRATASTRRGAERHGPPPVPAQRSGPTRVHMLCHPERPRGSSSAIANMTPPAGYQSETAGASGNTWVYDTTKPGNSNVGHSGAQFGTTLAEDQKAELWNI